jgi:omega-amidase
VITGLNLIMSTLTITIIQTDLSWEDKAANLSMFEKKINSIQGRTEVVVLPEMFSTGFSMNPYVLAETMEGESVKWMKRMAAEKNIILTGSLIISEDGPGINSEGEAHGPRYFNRLVWMLPNGQYGMYDKRHRFAFAGEDEHYTAGTKRLIASVKGWKINLQVCYDLRFPVWSRQAPAQETENSASPEYDLLLYVANWPERRSHAWKTLLQARAIENQAYVVGVNRVGNDGNQVYHGGDSMIVDPLGEVLYHKHEEEDIFTITLDKSHLDSVRARFPFWKDADRFWIDNV